MSTAAKDKDGKDKPPTEIVLPTAVGADLIDDETGMDQIKSENTNLMAFYLALSSGQQPTAATTSTVASNDKNAASTDGKTKGKPSTATAGAATEGDPEAEIDKVEEEKNKMDLDHKSFAADLDLLEFDQKMLSSKRSLDSDMQMLVYENYNKFISATDMIRKMKDNVDSMEEEMNNLLRTMDDISKSCTSLEDRFRPNREKVENLVGVNRLLKRLEFLFELPGRLKKSIELGALAQAVKYFRISHGILQSYKHIKSFAKIQLESEEIIAGLKKTLRNVVRDPNSGATTQMENAAMLMDLNEPIDTLLTDLLNTRKARLRKDMNAAVEQHKHAQAAEQKEAIAAAEAALRAKKDEPSTPSVNASDNADDTDDDSKRRESSVSRRSTTSVTSAAATSSGGAIDEDAMRSALFDGRDPSTPPPALPLRPHAASFASASANTAATAAAAGGLTASGKKKSNLIELLHSAFVESLSLFVDTFLESFIRHRNKDHHSHSASHRHRNTHPPTEKNAAAKKKDALRQEAMEKCNNAIIDFTKELFVDYFAVARAELLKRGDIKTQSQSSAGGNWSVMEETGAVRHLTVLLKQFYTGLVRPSVLVPQARLLDRAAEIIEHTIRDCEKSVSDRTQHNIITICGKLHESIAAFNETVAAEPFKPRFGSGSGGDASDGEDGSKARPSKGGGGADDRDREIERRKKRRRKLLSPPLAIAVAIREELERSLHLLVPLLQTREYLPESLGFAFGDLAHGHLHHLLSFVNQTMLCGILRESEGPIYKPAPPPALKDLETVSHNRYPMFYLFLSLVCHTLETKEYTKAYKHLKTIFPPLTAGPSSSKEVASALDHGMPDVLARAKENTALLLQRYVEAHGIRVASIIRTKSAIASSSLPASSAASSKTDDKQPGAEDESKRYRFYSSVSVCTNILLKRLFEIECEVAELFAPAKRADSGVVGGVAGRHKSTSSSSDMDRMFKEKGLAGGPTNSAGGKGMSGVSGNAAGGGTSNTRDIERLFKEKVKIVSLVQPNRSSPLFAILKMIMKAFVEAARSATVSKATFVELQCDVHALRRELSDAIDDSDHKTFFYLCDEVVQSASDRCMDFGTTVQMMPTAELDKLIGC